jgi:hypothetical protein
MSKLKTCYNIELLTKCFENDQAIDIWYPEKINRDSKIKFICYCGRLNITTFRYIFKLGMKCFECKVQIGYQKSKEKNLLKRGCEYPGQSEDVKNKIKESNVKNWGCENVFQNPEIKHKSKETMLQKRGVEHNMQDPEIFEKSRKTRYQFKPYIFPSGKQVMIQGYENFALDKLLQTYSEDEITVGASLVPKIVFEYNKKVKRYFSDIFIPKNNLIIEVKSTYTMKKEFNLNLAKRKSCLEQGYDFHFWIKNPKGELIKKVNKDEEITIEDI